MADKKTISTIEKQDDGTIKLVITLPIADVKKTWDKVVDNYASSAKLPGFRPGKAPKKLVEENVDSGKVQEEVLRTLLPESYIAAVSEHKLNPIMNPKIHVAKVGNPNNAPVEDWEFEALTCEMPTIRLGDYKKNVKAVTAKSKIIVPGQEPKEPEFNEVMKAIVENVETKIPKLLIDQEVDKMLSQTLNEIKSLGLTLDQYLSSSRKTPETLRDEYAKKAEDDIKLEFTLSQIAEEEKITVEEKEIDEAINKAQNPEEKAHLSSNRYLLASILRQQKTIDFIKSL